MKNIIISDVTLRKMAEQSTASLSFNEKTVLVKELDRLNINVIECAPITNGKKDILFLHTISSIVKNSVIACPVGLSEESVAETYDAIKTAIHPRLIISIPVSTVQMEYISKKKPAKVLELLTELTKKAKELCDDLEVELLDCTRAEHSFLTSAISTAIESGATTITLCDDSGDMLPDEFKDFVKTLYTELPALKNVNLAIMANDKIGMALAVATSAVCAGADEIKTVISGADVPKVNSIIKVIRERGNTLEVKTDVNVAKLENVVDKMKFISDSKRESVTPFDNGTGSTATHIVLDASAAISDIADAVVKMGYDLVDEDIKNVYDEFVKTASKKSIGRKELESIVASVAMQVPPTYKLKSYVINSGDIITPTANIEIIKGSELLRGFSIGDGPIEAAFLAIEKITGHHYELDDFQIQSVTQGYEAMGSSFIKLRHNGKVFSGTGTSTDIVGASINAYISALNKISYEEGIA